MNAYDFDKTIYKNDSTADFYKYCIIHHPKVLLALPMQGLALIKWAFGIYNKTMFKEKFYTFLRYLKNVYEILENFWDSHENNINEWYKNKHKDDDIIISASPEFLLKPICKRLHISNLIASKVDNKTGRYDGLNCYGSEKVKRLREYMPNYNIEEFYSDSLSDTPLAEISKKSFIVKKDRFILWKEYQPSTINKFIKTFISRNFFFFILIGFINTFNSTFIAALFSLIVDANIAFIIGYILSLSINYILNSVVNFKEKLSFNKFIKFCISYIPNFIIQNVIVFLTYNCMHIHKFISYALAALIGIPVTFIVMKTFTFKKK